MMDCYDSNGKNSKHKNGNEFDDENDSNIINSIPETNSIYFIADINAKTMAKLIQELLQMEQTILKKHEKLKTKIETFTKTLEEEDKVNCQITATLPTITLYITSNGGYVYQALNAIDTIKSIKVPVNTVCKGIVASAGTLLSLAGKKRFITPNAYMMIHELRSGCYGKYTYLTESLTNSTQLMNHIKEMYLANTKIPEKKLIKYLKKDVYWNAQRCLDKGLVDEILS